MVNNNPIKDQERWKSIFFLSDFKDKICSFCTQFPLCKYLTYKELAIIRLLQHKSSRSNDTKFFSLSKIHAEFLKTYRIEKDGYNKFKDFLTSLEKDTRLIIKMANKSLPAPSNVNKKTNIKNKRDRKRKRKLKNYSNGYYYALTPLYALDSFDLHTLAIFCPIGFDNLSYQILELLNRVQSLTINEIVMNLEDFGIIACERTIRRRMRDLLAVGIVFSIKPTDITKPISYTINTSYFYPTKNELL